jgi:hypothetical protein
LAIVYQIVQAHEGKVWARSRTGQGTTFILKLRRLDAERKAAPPTAEVNASSLPVMQSAALATAAAAAEGGRRD